MVSDSVFSKVLRTHISFFIKICRGGGGNKVGQRSATTPSYKHCLLLLFKGGGSPKGNLAENHILSTFLPLREGVLIKEDTCM